MIQDILDLMKDNSGIELRAFNKIDRCVLAEWSGNINYILKQIRTKNYRYKYLDKSSYSLCRKKACGSKKIRTGTLLAKKF